MKYRIMVADSDPFAYDTLKEVFDDFEIDSLSVNNSKDGYRKFLEFGPDAIFVDAMLPRPDGFEFIESIRYTQGGGLAIFVASPFVDSTLRRRAKDKAGAIALFKKPFKEAEVRAEVEKLLSSRPKAQASVERYAIVPRVPSEGEFKKGELPRILGGVSQRQAPCRLILSSGKVQKALYLKGGNVQFVISNAIKDTLLRFLLNRGVIDQDIYTRALDTSLESKRRVGEVLVEMGAVDHDMVDSAIRRNIVEKTLDPFTWEEGRFKVLPPAEVPGDIPGGPIRADSLLWTIVHEQMGQAEVASALEPYYERKVLKGHDLDMLNGVEELGDYSKNAASLVGRIVDRRLGETIKANGIDTGFLFFLFLRGYLALTTPDYAAALGQITDKSLKDKLEALLGDLGNHKWRNFFQVLGVSSDTDDQGIKTAWDKLVKSIEAPWLPVDLPTDVRAIIDNAKAHAYDAYEALKTEEKRKAYIEKLKFGEETTSDDQEKTLRAESAYQAGLSALRLRDLDKAVEKFSEAVELCNGEIEYYLHLGVAWMHHHKPDKATGLANARKALTAAHELGPKVVEPLFQLGKLSEVAQDLPAAARYYKKALHIEPDHFNSKVGLKRVERKSK